MANSKQKLGLEMVYIILMKHASFMYDKFQMNIFLNFFTPETLISILNEKITGIMRFFLFDSFQ